MPKKRNFSDLFKRYKTYDPQQDGYGSPEQWRSAFNERMGVKEARTVLSDASPLAVLGLDAMPATKDELKRAYRRLMMTHHPDRGGDVEKAKQIIAAYTVLENEF